MAEIENVKKKNLIRRINNLSQNKINALENYLDKIEQSNNSKEEILSFAGIFKDFDDDFFSELTNELHYNRKSGRARIE